MSVAQGTTRVPPRVRNNDVTPAIYVAELGIGGSDYTGQHSQAASQSLNFIDGPTLQRPNKQVCLTIPMEQRWEDAVGLFGAENKFIRYDVKYNKEWAAKCYEDDGYECMRYLPIEKDANQPEYVPLKVDRNDNGTVLTYDPADVLLFGLPEFKGEATYVSVELINNKTGNIYNDAHVDGRLYTKDRIEFPHNKMYLRYGEWFYVGFHARNTRRLPLDMTVVIGNEYKPLSLIKDRDLIMQAIPYHD
jgi:hypothetical protein